MLTLEEMLVRLVVALALGALMGIERELVGKEAGIRTSMMVAGGSALFTIIALAIPYLVATAPSEVPNILAGNAGYLNVISNIFVAIGFVGAGIIIKSEGHVHGLTTAAIIWATSAIGILVGLGLMQFAAITAVMIAVILYFLRTSGVQPQNGEVKKTRKVNKVLG